LRIKGLALTWLIPAVIAVGCGEQGGEQRAPAATETSALPSSEAAVDRTVAIYASVIRQLVIEDHTYGRNDPGFKVVYILDGPVEGAQDSMKTTDEYVPKARFPEDVKTGLKDQLADLPPLVFVAERSSAIEGEKGGTAPGHVVNDGVLLTLGPIIGDRRRVEVGSSLWINGLAGFWATYVVERRGGAWTLTGTTGTVAIS
jgi:hypothetical protein